MKRILAALGLLAIVSTALWAADMMSVQVSEGELRARAGFTSPVVTNVVYGDQVEILRDYRGWYQVKTDDRQSGWIHGSALTDKRIVLSSSGDVATGASSDEVALAGKGFNAEIEAEYKSQTSLDFSWVDRMQTWGISTEDLISFLDKGELEEVAE